MKSLPKSRSEAKELNSPHYFTGKPCKNGHVSFRYTLKGGCGECSRLYAAKSLREDPERIKANKEKYSKANRCKERARCKSWRESNKDKYKESQRNWEKNNGEKRRLMASHRRAAIAKAGGVYTIDQIHEMLINQNYICADQHCESSLRDGYHIDHIVPLCKGGSNYISNIQCLCQRCNTSKGGKMPSEWEEYKAKVLHVKSK